MRNSAVGAAHSRRRPVMTSGQSCASTKGSTRDRFMAGRGAEWRTQCAASSKPGLLSMRRAGERQSTRRGPALSRLVLLHRNKFGASGWLGVVRRFCLFDSALWYCTPTHSHYHPPISPRPFCTPRARLSPPPARPSSPASSIRARTTSAAGATAASPRTRAASAPGRYSSTTSLSRARGASAPSASVATRRISYYGTFTRLLIRGRAARCGYPQTTPPPARPDR